MGGLGNMMFQVAALESLAPGKIAYQGWPDKYAGVFQNFKPSSTFAPARKKLFEFGYQPLTYEEGTLYSGYFQSWRFLDPAIVRKLFAWSASTLSKVSQLGINPTNACALHVRRGDYLRFPRIHPVLSADYYKQAVDHLKPQRILIFSDDLAWCKDNLMFDVSTEFIEAPDYISLALMSQCSSAIIANSTFSWWGAWLANVPTIAPALWFGPDGPSSKDILPDSWLQL